MADPSGPTVAEGPEEQEATSTDPSAETGSASGDAPKPAPAAPPESAAEGTPPAADDTGTVDASPDPVTTTSVDPTPEASTTTPDDRWPAAAAPEVGSAEPLSGKTGVAGSEPSRTATEDADVDVVDRDADDEDGGDDEVDDDGDDDRDDGGARRKGGVLDKKVQVDAKVLLVVLGFLALAVGAYLLGQRQAKDDDAAAGDPKTTVATTFVQPTEYVPFVDEETGIKLSIPKGWTQRSTKNLGPEARMLIEVPNTQDTVLVRVNSYSQEVTKENLNDQKAVIDAIFAGEKVTILGVEAGELKGRPVLVYVYRFNDPQTGVAGIHAHYFVFQGRKAVQLVFQALPENHYTSGGLGLVWGKISESLEVTPGPPPAFLEQLGGSPTTAPGAAPAPTAPPPSAPPPTG